MYLFISLVQHNVSQKFKKNPEKVTLSDNLSYLIRLRQGDWLTNILDKVGLFAIAIPCSLVDLASLQSWARWVP